jgi:putative effector of murein hydrolase LrgA (UPF0299 family)
MVRIAARFFVAGTVIATALAFLFMLDYKKYLNIGMPSNDLVHSIYLLFWPSSIMLIGVGEALNSTWVTIVPYYVISILMNGLLYSILGLCVGGMVRLFSKP